MSKKLFIIAGEPSGDLIGSRLIAAIINKNSKLRLGMIGGTRMSAHGINSLFPMNDIAIMGFLELLPRLPKILFRVFQTYRYLLKFKPDLLVTIDSPGFNFLLVKLLRRKLGNRIKIIHYVAPSVWAYKPERVKVVKNLFDHQLLILPFELPYFAKQNIPATYVGHPIFDEPILGISKEEEPYLLTIMPGSRKGEIKYHGEIFAKCCQILRQSIPNLQCAVITLPHLKQQVKQYFNQEYMSIVDNDYAKHETLLSSRAALIKSGTSSLEVLRYMVPMVIAYKVNRFTAWYIKAKLKIKYISIINIIAKKQLVPELLQARCTAELIANKLLPLLTNDRKRQSIKNDYEMVMKAMQDNKEKSTASEKAAEVIFDYLK